MAKSTISGVRLRQDELSWTTYRRKGKTLERMQAGSVPLDLPEPAEGEEAPAPEVHLAALKKASSKIKGVISLGVPTERVMLRVVDLPSVDPEEIEGMVELKVDRFSPFPSDRMVISHEVIREDAEQSRVLIAAAQRDYIQQQCGMFVQAGHPPHRIDIEVLGWLYLIERQGILKAKGRELLLIMEPHGVELVVLEDGIPMLFRSLGSESDLLPAEFAQELAEETHYTLTAMEAEWGGADLNGFMIWGHGAVNPAVTDALKEACGVSPSIHVLDELPDLSEGIAQRALLPDAEMLDLAPDEWHQQEASKALQKKLLKSVAAMFALWLVVVVIFSIFFSTRKSRIVALRERALALEGPASEVQLVIQKIDEMKQFSDRRYSAIECLREVSEVLPPGVDLTSFLYKKGKEISLKGETSPTSVNLVYDFFNDMEESPLFEGIDKQQVMTSGSGAKQRARFTLKAYLPGGTPDDETE